ncbi:MAG: hypothetical protein DI551_02535 [Micavibrio aeruginosavorus]|uniref:Uncharacterized protein n=1 Tax=Micavibrio aeruginosavorus TaxID=349221 RepID=A0A2W5N6C9_9BACT|nr:MAG: hypothetical protein DI551_02535 [Micavibrio aeruginosavorus]
MDQIPMKNQASPAPNAQSGSILIWILIMVGLFGALSFAMSQGSRTSASNINAEQAKLVGTEIIDYARLMRDTVKSLRVNGCKDTDISFYGIISSSAASAYDNANTPVADEDYKCHVFNGKGGGINPQKPPEGFPAGAQYYVTGHTAVQGVGTAEPDLVLILKNIDVNVCTQINKTLGVQNYASDDYADANEFDGDYPGSAAQAIGDDNTNPDYVAGQPAACVASYSVQAANTYFLYYVLLGR